MPGLRLEVFELTESGAAKAETVPVTEEARLQGYEQGYAAGWEDAVAAQSAEQARLHAELARNLQSLSFTFEEARVHVMAALGPFLQQLVTRLLPEIARAALAPVVHETLLPFAAQASESPVILRINPVARRHVEDLLARGPSPFADRGRADAGRRAGLSASGRLRNARRSRPRNGNAGNCRP
ncbi:MAG: hypothetical protein U5N10_19655 [Gemmobacter sp.]|nr:hypothetical protein [Gemmobacter sp.]